MTDKLGHTTYNVGCELRQLAALENWGTCQGECQTHHILNKSLLMKNKKARSLVEKKYAHLFLAQVCAWHNTSRFADTKKARSYLIQKRVEKYGDEVNTALEEIRATYKSDMPQLRLSAILR